jgi:peptidyl-prolyl cis-trans isomerase D
VWRQNCTFLFAPRKKYNYSMLQAIRDNAQGVIIWIIVVLVILGLSSFILSSYLGSNVKNYAAKVNDVEISTREFSMAFNNRQAQLQQQLGENFSRFFDENLLRTSVLNGLVEAELVTQLSHEAGFRNSAEQAKQSLASIPAFQDEQGNFSNEKFANIVAQYGYSPEGYAVEQAISLSNQQFINGISDTAFVPGSTLTEFQRLARQQRKVGLLSVSLVEVSKNIELSDEQVKSWFEQHAAEFMTPEQVKVDYVELSLKGLIDQQDVDEDEIRDYFDKNKATYTKDDFSTAEKKIKEIQARIKKGESFSKLAREQSEDIASAQEGGDLGFFGKGIMDPAFEKVVYELNKGEISQPVKTSFGYHLIKLEDIDGEQRRARHILVKKDKVAKSYEEVKATIANVLKTQKAERAFYEGQTKLENLTYQHPDSLEPAAEAIGITIKTSPFFTRTGGPQMFRNPDLLREAFSEEVLQEALNSNVIKLSEDHFVVLRLKEHKPSRQKTFEQVKAAARSKLKQEKAGEQVAVLIEQYLQLIKEGAAPEKLAAEHKALSWQQHSFIGREPKYDATQPKQGETQSQSDKLGRDIRSAIFKLEHPEAEKPVYHDMTATNGNGVIIILSAVRANPAEVDKNVLESMQNQFTQAAGRSDVSAVIEYMRSQSDIEIPATAQEDEL